jgi:uncharacterized caspase-like protein/Tfp pilus assembly protein PilF
MASLTNFTLKVRKWCLSTAILMLFAVLQVSAQYSTRYALLVGIGEYPKESGWPKIHGDRDAERMAEALNGYSFLPSNTTRLVNQRATREMILHSFNQLFRQVESGDIVYIHFSGHFQQISDQSGDESDQLDEGFVTWDSKRMPEGKNPGRGLLTDDEISHSLSMIREKLTRIGQLVLVFDGGLADGFGARGTASAIRNGSPSKPAASKKNQPRANEWADWEEEGQHPFTVQIQPAQPVKPVTEVAQKGDTLGPVTARLLEVLSDPGTVRTFADLAKRMESSNLNPSFQVKVHVNTELEFFSRRLSKRKEFTGLLQDKTASTKDSRVFAVCIGVSEYPGERKKLRFAHSDARSFYQLLQAAYGEKLVTDTSFLLLNEKATQARIFQLLDRLRADIKPGDRLYFYFAGHGDVEGSLINKPTFFLLPGGSEYSYSSGGHLPFDLLRNYISTFLFNGAQVFLLVDACRSGNLAGTGEESEEISNGVQKIDRGQSVKILACQPNERSREGEEFGGGFGAFTWYLLRGLEGKADTDGNKEISLQEINGFLADSVSSKTGNKQNPLIEGPGSLPFLPRPKKFSARELARQKLAQKKAEIDQAISQLEQRFQEQLKKKNLVEPSDNCALFWLGKLEEAANGREKMKKRWREELSEAINNKTQQTINQYIAGNESIVKESVFQLGAKEIAVFLDHNPSTHALYAQMLARRYFFEAQALSPVAADSDRDRQKLDSAINHMRTALYIENRAAHLPNAIGRLFWINHQPDSAIRYFNQAIALAPRWKFPYNNKGGAYQEKMKTTVQGNKKPCLDSAVKAYEQAIRLDNRFAVAHRNLGRLNYQAGRSGLAKQLVQKAIFLDRKDAIAYHLLADLYKEEQNWDSAYYVLNQGMLIAPENTELNLDLANCNFDLAQTLPVKSKDSLLMAALMQYRKVFRVQKNNPECINGLIISHVALQQFDSVVHYSQLALNLNAQDSSSALFLIDGLLKLRRPEEAREKLIAYEALLEGSAYFHLLWFQLHMQKKSPEKALPAYRKALAAGLRKEDFQDLAEWLAFRKSKEYLRYSKAGS